MNATDEALTQTADAKPAEDTAPGGQRTGAGFLRPVVVVVPVYNAPKMVAQLVTSLTAAVPEPLDGLSFLFSDDASPDPGIEEVLSGPFFQRPDVRVLRHARNSGFIGNVNGAILASPEDADIIILNSDTEVWEEIFSVLQQEAHADPQIASITPLTNNGTIGSVFDFPTGHDVPPELSAERLAKLARRLGLPMVDHPAPTGVGFCMYLKREAIRAVGLLDTAYGRGYGEECDWCRRAMTVGFKHLVTPKAFVLHVGTQSFLSDEKRASIEANGRLLLSRFPEYDWEVAQYIDADPLKFSRITLLLAAAREHLATLGTELSLMTLHADPDAPSAGGTERHVRMLRGQLVEGGNAVLELFPIAPTVYVLEAHLSSGRLFRERVHASTLTDLLEFLEPFVDTLHVHHTLHWREDALRSLAAMRVPRKLVSAHDYFLVCPTIHMLRAPEERVFCEVERDLDACNRCLRSQPAQAQMSIEVYRARNQAFLEQFDALLFPSASLLPHFERAFGAGWERLGERAEVLHHDLSHILEHASPLPAERKRPRHHVTFIGGIGPHKGSREILEAIPRLRQIGFTVEILGSITPNDARALEGVPVRPYQGISELADLLRQTPSTVIALPSNGAETFCYAFYEAVFLSETAVPVVGPHGNPATVLAAHGFGVTMDKLSADALVSACLRAAKNWSELWPRRNRWREDLTKEFTPYVHTYRHVGRRQQAAHEGPRPSDLELRPDRLYRMELAARQVPVRGAPGAPAGGGWPVPASAATPADAPLRHQVVDRMNASLKKRLPGLHALGKRLAGRAS